MDRASASGAEGCKFESCRNHSHKELDTTNVKEDDGGYTIEVAVPGMEGKNFHMRVHDGVLSIYIASGRSRDRQDHPAR